MPRGWNKPIRINTPKGKTFTNAIKLGFGFMLAYFVITILPTLVSTITDAFESGLP